MLIEFHCPCGFRLGLTPAKLKPAVRCGGCKSVLRFAPDKNAMDATLWMAVGGQTGDPRLAVPIPIGTPLKVGRAAAGWLSLPGEDIEETQVELCFGEDGRLDVKHLGGDTGTWINRARIASGVLRKEDRLRIGPYVLRLMDHHAVQCAAEGTLEPEVIVETTAGIEKKPTGRRRRDLATTATVVEVEVDEDEEGVGSAEHSVSDEEVDYRIGWTTGQKVRAALSVLMIMAAGGLLARSYLWPEVSEEMPVETVFYCPADATPVRGVWSASTGAPICPQCGQRCIGELRYKSELANPPPASAPAETTTAPASAEETKKPPPARKENGKKKKPRTSPKDRSPTRGST